MRLITITKIGSIGTLTILMASQGFAAPQDEGRWSSRINWPINPASTVLTPQGTVMSVGANKYTGWENGVLLNSTDLNYFYNVWNPDLGTGNQSHKTVPDTTGIDTAQSTAIVIPETGNVLIAGGLKRNAEDRGYDQTKDIQIFNLQSNTGKRIANMKHARFTPAATVLSNGEILLSNGFKRSDRPSLAIREVFSPASNQTRSLLPEADSSYVNYNGLKTTPWQWVSRTGKVAGFFPWGEGFFSYDLETRNSQSSGFPDKFGGFSSDVMYRPGKILHVNNDLGTTFVIDTNGSTPWALPIERPTVRPRNTASSVVLPNGKVMISGYDAPPELWDPNTQSWSKLAQPTEKRDFLLSTLLLKDGRVLLTGELANPQRGVVSPNDPKTAEIFSPPYLFNSSGQAASRPTIVSAPANAANGSKVFVKHQAGNSISRVTLIKTGAIARSINSEQRFIELKFDNATSGVNVTLPYSANVAPPGYYLMYLLNNAGVPSKGHIIKVAKTVQSGAYPVAISDSGTSTGGAAITLNVLANDTGNGLSLVTVNQYSQQGGTAKISSGKIVFTPKSGFVGTDAFWYVMKDNQGRRNSAKVTVTVTSGGSDAYPTAAQDNVTTTTATQTTIDVLANDTGNGLVLNAPNAWSLKGGRVSLANNKIVYKSKSGFTGSDKIWYSFKDSQNRSNSGQVNITVNSGGSAAFPVAKADYYTTAKNTAKTLNILGNDTPSGSVSIDNLYAYTAKGGRTSKVNGKVLYTPKANFTGEDNFWYAITDAQGRKNSAQVKINVTP